MTKFMSDIKIFEKGSEYNGFCVLNVFELRLSFNGNLFAAQKNRA